MLSSIFTDFGRGDPSPTMDRFCPINPNLNPINTHIQKGTTP
jgi:hypothetical protein